MKLSDSIRDYIFVAATLACIIGGFLSLACIAWGKIKNKSVHRTPYGGKGKKT